MRSPNLLSLVAISTALIGLSTSQDSVSTDPSTYGINDNTPYQSYISSTNLKPPEFLVTTAKTGAADGYIFLGIDGEPCIFDMSLGTRMGSMVWCGLNYTEPFDFRMQMYQGEPHLTFLSGKLLSSHGHGNYYILNASYALVDKFSPIGFENAGDLHEFYITDHNTALVTIYTTKQADLTSVGGDSNGWIYDCHFQEIDIATKELLFQWNASAHVSINETYMTLDGTGTQEYPFDWFHINAVSKDANGDYLISGRVMSAVYKISGTDGHIIWRFNGRKSDFTIAPDSAKFVFQHNPRWINTAKQDKMTLFDNQDGVLSKGLLFAIDQGAKTAELITEFLNGNKTWAQFEGSMQSLGKGGEGNFLLGFGVEPYFTELDNHGNIILDVQFGLTEEISSYRAFKFPWVGEPTTKPDIAYVASEKKVYVSWNGATEVECWVIAVNSAKHKNPWKDVAKAYRTGFETVIELDSEIEYVSARAVDINGTVLRWSDATDGVSFLAIETFPGR